LEVDRFVCLEAIGNFASKIILDSLFSELSQLLLLALTADKTGV